VVERLPGDATTDYGAPGARPAADAAPVDPAELRRMLAIMKAAWRTFDAAVGTAQGKELRKGPRGGGRDVPEIVRHLVDADGGYLGRIGARLALPASSAERLRLAHRHLLPLPKPAAKFPTGPRGGVRWGAPSSADLAHHRCVKSRSDDSRPNTSLQVASRETDGPQQSPAVNLITIGLVCDSRLAASNSRGCRPSRCPILRRFRRAGTCGGWTD
jgi:hypothetical protein